MSLYKCPKFKIRIDPDSKKTQGLQQGDIVRRQYFDYPNIVYSLMIVTETGTDIIAGKDKTEQRSPYFIGMLVEGDEPKNGEILDFVRTTNLFNADRSGALYLTASDSESPFMDVIDGMATENSLCYPVTDGGDGNTPSSYKYACCGKGFVSQEYTKTKESDVHRVFRITRNGTANPSSETIGFKQTIEKQVKNPQCVVISYKIRASKNMDGVVTSFGYTDGTETDGTDTINITTSWQYKLSLIVVDYPSQYMRSFLIDLTDHLSEGDWCEISDLNIVLLSDIANFSDGTKARIGKVTGIVDPVFGLLDGYGGYFQNFYATRNVNIAGTLTAGDEKGFASTFYVGKIHKNCLINSLYGNFQTPVSSAASEVSPTGLGDVFVLNSEKTVLIAQTESWANEHKGEKLCFSCWLKCEEIGKVHVFQNSKPLYSIDIETAGEWVRYSVPFVAFHKENEGFNIEFSSDIETIYLSSPQLEFGERATLYQATDEVLDDTDDYGAWFNRGGIGGTIQNPLLRLNDDGSISSNNNSFVINRDGTGHFAGGKFKWTEDTIELTGVTIKWGDMDEETQDNIVSKSVKITGEDTFHYPDRMEDDCSPDEIQLIADEYNFTSKDDEHEWSYLSSSGEWIRFPGVQKNTITVKPDFEGWEGRDTLTVMYSAIYNETEYRDSFTITKRYDGVTGEDAYALHITSSNGQIFKNGVVHSTLTAHVYRGGMDITGEIPPDWFDWKRSSLNPKSDAQWNSVKRTGSVLEITEKDVERKAVFDCVVHLENIKENFLDIFPRALYLDESNKFSQNVQVYSNIEWSISQLPAWLTVDHVNGSENKTIVNAEKNHYIGRTERTGTVTITGLGIQTPQTYKVIQEGVPEFISIGNGTDITIDDVGGEIVISGKSNSEKLLYFWIGDEENGVLSSNYTAGGKTTANGQAIEGDPGAIQEFDWSIRVNLPANYTDSQIIRTLKVTNGGIVSAQIAIRQNFKETTLSIVPNEVTIPEDLSAISINVISNTDWEIL